MVTEATRDGTLSRIDDQLLSALKKSKILTEDLAADLLERSEAIQDVFERLLLREGYLTDQQLGQLKASVHNWHFVKLRMMPVTQESISLLPRLFREEQKVVPFTRDDQLRIATANPAKKRVAHLLRKKFGPNVPVLYATPTDVADVFAQKGDTFDAQFEHCLDAHLEAITKGKTNERSIIEFVDAVLLHALRSHASDIHIEPRKHTVYIRERVDGVLKTVVRVPIEVHQLITTRIKVLAGLATDEHARPQDGKLQYEGAEGKVVDVRVSLSPTTDGEKAVLRMLASQDSALPLEALGMLSEDLEAFEDEASRSWGMILVTGPTGSGKTTSLYAAVRRLHTDDVNIATIEDPVEYDLPGVNQIQVQEKVDMTFATGLRSILRQDPNIILVGEIRDQETAGIAINAAMTGHLVFSTLHTNDAATAIPRLIDMDIEPFLIASTVNVIIAQRLVRKICESCRMSVEVPVKNLKDSLSKDSLKKLAKGKKTVRMYEGKGCPVCNGSGYMGRAGIFELLHVNDTIEDLIMKNANAEEINKAAIKNGMRTMFDDGIKKILQGTTTLEEVLRAIRT